MSRQAWTDIALALAALRSKILEHAEKSSDKNRLTHIARVEGVDLSARTICKTLRSRSTRFDGRRFMKIVGTQTK